MSYDFSNCFRQDEEGVETYTLKSEERIWIEGFFGTYEVFFMDDDNFQISCSTLQEAMREAIIYNGLINPETAT